MGYRINGIMAVQKCAKIFCQHFDISVQFAMLIDNIYCKIFCLISTMAYVLHWCQNCHKHTQGESWGAPYRRKPCPIQSHRVQNY